MGVIAAGAIAPAAFVCAAAQTPFASGSVVVDAR
jgi:hypothetical protein